MKYRLVCIPLSEVDSTPSPVAYCHSHGSSVELHVAFNTAKEATLKADVICDAFKCATCKVELGWEILEKWKKNLHKCNHISHYKEFFDFMKRRLEQAAKEIAATPEKIEIAYISLCKAIICHFNYFFHFSLTYDKNGLFKSNFDDDFFAVRNKKALYKQALTLLIAEKQAKLCPSNFAPLAYIATTIGSYNNQQVASSSSSAVCPTQQVVDIMVQGTPRISFTPQTNNAAVVSPLSEEPFGSNPSPAGDVVSPVSFSVASPVAPLTEAPLFTSEQQQEEGAGNPKKRKRGCMVEETLEEYDAKLRFELVQHRKSGHKVLPPRISNQIAGYYYWKDLVTNLLTSKSSRAQELFEIIKQVTIQDFQLQPRQLPGSSEICNQLKALKLLDLSNKKAIERLLEKLEEYMQMVYKKEIQNYQAKQLKIQQEEQAAQASDHLLAASFRTLNLGEKTNK